MSLCHSVSTIPGPPDCLFLCLCLTLFLSWCLPCSGVCIPCFCRWISEYISLCSCFSHLMCSSACACVLGSLLPSLGMCLCFPMSIFLVLRSLCFVFPYVSIALFPHLCLCPCYCLSVCDPVSLVVSMYVCVSMLCHGIIFCLFIHSFIRQIFPKLLPRARHWGYIDDSEKFLALKELTV